MAFIAKNGSERWNVQQVQMPLWMSESRAPAPGVISESEELDRVVLAGLVVSLLITARAAYFVAKRWRK